MLQRVLIFSIGMLSFILPCCVFASFIETTMGTAIVNDATAAYFNPAALTLLKNPQVIPLLSVARFNTQFTGQTSAVATGFNESGSASTTTYFESPSFYIGIPVNKKLILGFSAVSNFANRNPEENAILRYVQSSNTIQDYDFVPSIGIKINNILSIGAGINFSYTTFNLQPLIGFPGTNIADSQSRNQTTGSGVGVNVGLLFRPRAGTLMGFDYRSVTTYDQRGSSTVTGTTSITSNNYHYQMHTPARFVLSIGQMFTPKGGMIATVQRIQWNIIQNINVYNIATQIGSTPLITNASIPYYLHNTWVTTLGGNYRFYPNWIARIAGTYSQSPDDGSNQISVGDSFILGGSLGYQMTKSIALDGSYAHAFIQNQPLNITGNRFLVSGVNKASRDVVSLKLTFNL